MVPVCGRSSSNSGNTKGESPSGNRNALRYGLLEFRQVARRLSLEPSGLHGQAFRLGRLPVRLSVCGCRRTDHDQTHQQHAMPHDYLLMITVATTAMTLWPLFVGRITREVMPVLI